MYGDVAAAIEYHFQTKAAGPTVLHDIAVEEALVAANDRITRAASGNADRHFDQAATAGILHHQNHIHSFARIKTAATFVAPVTNAGRAAFGRCTRGDSNRRRRGRGWGSRGGCFLFGSSGQTRFGNRGEHPTNQHNRQNHANQTHDETPVVFE
jgi:hypothetical protein